MAHQEADVGSQISSSSLHLFKVKFSIQFLLDFFNIPNVSVLCKQYVSWVSVSALGESKDVPSILATVSSSRVVVLWTRRYNIGTAKRSPAARMAQVEMNSGMYAAQKRSHQYRTDIGQEEHEEEPRTYLRTIQAPSYSTTS